jgi:integrase
MGRAKSRANGDGDVFPRKNKQGKITSYRGAYVGPDGKRRYPSRPSHFKPLLKRAQLPAIRLHDLRHTCATILLMAGKHPKYVQELLGHANISITLDTYSHVIEGMDGGLGDAMDEAL